MQTQQEYLRPQERCLYFDANGNRVPQPCQNAAPAYDPWLALTELEKQSDLDIRTGKSQPGIPQL